MMKLQFNHIPVLLDECVELLNIKPDGIYVDCTFGRGGHSKAILSKLNDKGKLIAIDCDQEAIDYAKATIKDDRFIIVKDNFRHLDRILEQLNLTTVNGILFDLGVSSPQLDDSKRGFSFQTDALLDMRMDQDLKVSAYDIVNTYGLSKLNELFKKFGQSQYSYQVAKKIIEARKLEPIKTTLALVDIIKSALPKKELFKHKHPAKVFFQAIRIEVNDELFAINEAIITALTRLKEEGRLVVISFHSLENQVVKQAIKKITTKPDHLNYLPTNSQAQYRLIKAKSVSETEVSNNHRSHSAKLNVIERIKYE